MSRVVAGVVVAFMRTYAFFKCVRDLIHNMAVTY